MDKITLKGFKIKGRLRSRAAVFFCLVVLGLVGVSHAQSNTAPAMITFQGRLTDNLNNPLGGAHNFIFKIFDNSTGAGTALWTETQNGITVTNGALGVQLGAVTALSTTVFAGATTYLQITVDGTALSPLEQLVSVPYAMNSLMLGGRDYSGYVSTDTAAQVIAGTKTFSGAIYVPYPSSASQAASKAYVDSATGSGAVLKTGDSMSGPLTMISGATITISGNAFSVGGSSFTVSGGSATVAYGLTAAAFYGYGGNLSGLPSSEANTYVSSKTFTANAFSVGGSTLVVAGGRVGIGTTQPWEHLQIQSGNIFMDSASEQEIRMRRTGLANNPSFKLGRVILAGDGSPEFRVLYQSDIVAERSVFEFDEKGIVASVKPAVGSHFEGFISGESEPLFRLNSYPSMQLELGPGGATATDVYLRRPIANTLAFWTGGSERARIDSNGFLGISTAAATSKLHIHDGDIRISTTVGAASKGIYFQDGTLQTTAFGGAGNFVLKAGDGMTGPLTMLSGSTITVSGDAFSVGGSTLSVANGRVGVGTTSPMGDLHVKNASHARLRVDAGAGAESIINFDRDGAFIGQINTKVNDAIWFYAGANGSAPRLSVSTNVGIGTTDPIATFHVSSAASSATTPILVVSSGVSAGQELLRVQKDGNVGIGTTSPGQKFEVNGNIITSWQQVNASQWIGEAGSGGAVGDNTGFAGMELESTSAGSGRNVHFHTNNPGVDSLRRMTVAFNGNVGIGTTAPAGRLDINGGMIVRSSMTLANMAAPPVSVAGQGAIYFDTGLNQFMVSENAGGYTALLGGGGNFVAKAGDRMTGPLTMFGGSTITVTGNAFSVGGSTFVVTSGMIGIGTTNPLSDATASRVQLSLGGNGAVWVNNDSSNPFGMDTVANQLRLFSGNPATLAYQTQIGAMTSGAFTPYLSVGDGSANRGFVGIGITNPGYLLHVAGQSKVTGNSIFGGSNPATMVRLTAQGNTSDATAATFHAIANSGASLFYVRNDGNIGIGASNPATKLEVNGDAQFGAGATKSTFTTTGALSLAGNAALTLSGVSGNITSGSSVTASAFFGSGAALTGIPSTASISGTYVAKAGDSMTGPLTMFGGSTITVSGNAFSVGGSTLVVAGGKVGIGTATAQAVLDVITSANRHFTLGSVPSRTAGDLYSFDYYTADVRILENYKEGTGYQNMALAAGGGNVGIGTSDPKSPLHVAGILRVGLTATNTEGVIVLGEGNNGLVFTGLYKSSLLTGGVDHFLSLGGYDGIIFNASNVALGSQTERMRINSSGSVGIGTTGPSSTLHVSSAASLGTTPLLILSSGTAAGQEVLRVQANGFVGIGTTAPSYPLEVVGKIQSDTPQSDTKGLGGFRMGSAGGSGDGTRNFAIRAAAASGDVAFDIYGGSTWAEMMRITNGGSVGIGTTAPASTLHVSTASPGNYAVRVINTDAAANRPSGLYVQTTNASTTSTDPILKVGTSGSDMFQVSAGGNVGIGETAPSARLHVLSSTSAANALIIATGTAVSEQILRVSTDGIVFAAKGFTYGADLAEMYPSEEPAEAGDVMAVSPASGADNSKPLVLKATAGRREALMGVVSTNPGTTLGWNRIDQNEQRGHVALGLAGRIPVKVTSENGAVRPGDFLTVSSMRPGYAAKAVTSGMVVGMALEGMKDGAAEGKVMTFVNLQNWVAPGEFESLREEIRSLRKTMRDGGR